MAKTQEELRKQALAQIIDEELDKIAGTNYYGRIIISIRNGQAYQVNTEQTKDIAELVTKMQQKG